MLSPLQGLGVLGCPQGWRWGLGVALGLAWYFRLGGLGKLKGGFELFQEQWMVERGSARGRAHSVRNLNS